MIKTVDEYLQLLKGELAGCDAALVQDALSDAEEHLRTALAQRADAENVSETEALASIIEQFGSPREFAAGYLKMEQRVPVGLGSVTAGPERSALSSFFGVFADPKAWGALVYMLLALITGIIYFTWVVTGLSITLGLMVLIVGLPLLVLFLLSVRFIAFLEGRLVETLLGVRMPRRPLFFGQSKGMWQKIRSLFAEPTTWTGILYALLQMPVGIVYFTLAMTLLGASIYSIVSPFAALVLNMPPSVVIGDTRYQAANAAVPFLLIPVGVLLLTVTMHLARLAGRVQGAWAKTMLVSRKS